MADDREFNVKIVEEDGMLWAEVAELPGTFASGENMDELLEAVVEAINMVAPSPQSDKPRRRVRKSPPMPQPVVKGGQVAILA